MSQFVFIADVHLGAGANVRTGDVYQDIYDKLNWVKDYCNKYDCQLLIGGDLLDKPSVPYTYVTPLVRILKEFKYVPYDVFSNHPTLYNNREYDYKTTQNMLYEVGVLRELHTVEYSDCFITSETPLVTKGKPQILIKHAFLNVQDPGWTVEFPDLIGTDDNCYVCLGHDHVEYEPLQIKQNIKIFRPGSFLRATRDDSNVRIPNLLHIRVVDGKLQYKLVPIKTARPVSEIFKTKFTKVSEHDKHETYEAIIEQIRNANATELTLNQALNQVSTQDVCDYVQKLLQSNRIIKQHSKANL